MNKNICDGKGYNTTKAFSYFSKVSDEKKLQLENILNQIEDLNKTNYLDIGSGAGDVFLDLTKYFENSVGVEPGDKMFELLNQRKQNLDNNNSITLFKNTWQEFYNNNSNNYKNKFDLITSIHSIYFLKDLKNEINKVLTLLNNKGKFIIICSPGHSLNKETLKEDFISYFRHKFVGGTLEEKPYCNLQNKLDNINIKKIEFVSKIKLVNVEELEKDHLSDLSESTNNFFKFMFKKWWDEYTTEEKEEFKIVLEKYKTKDNNYLIEGTQVMYIIEK